MSKAIVFDVDETIGSFTQLFILWKIINKYFEKNNIYNNLINSQFLFNLLLDNFPLFLRTNIVDIFQYILKEKQQNKIEKVILYTNNQISKEWINYIVKYIEYKLDDKIFDVIICSYKINNQIIEPERTTYEKTYMDLIKISNLTNYKICFVDDLIHKKMIHPCIYYILVPAYFYYYSLNKFLEIFCNLIDINNVHFTEYINKSYKKYFFEKKINISSNQLFTKIKYFTNA
jgi:hypothetical protein